MYALGNCTMKANFDVRPVELILSTFQAALLLLFNNGAGGPYLFGRVLQGLNTLSPQDLRLPSCIQTPCNQSP